MNDSSMEAEAPKTNGNGVVDQREKEFAKWLAEKTTERDEATTEAMRLKAQATGLFTKIEVLEAQLADAESKQKTAELIRDQAVARRAELETVLASVLSLLRTFQIQHEPLLREPDEFREVDEEPTIGGA